MNSYLVLLFVLGVSSVNCYVLAESGSGEPRRLSAEQDSESFKKPLQDIESSDDDDESDDEVMKDLQDRFTASMVRLLNGGDELYKDARFDNIINLLKTTTLTSTGEIDEDYIRKVVETFKKYDAAKGKEVDEVMMNQLGFSKSDFQDFLDTFANDIKRSGLPAAPRSPKRSALASDRDGSHF